MALINQPPTTPTDDMQSDRTLVLNPEWRNFFNAAWTLLTGLSQSGTTANRPTKGVYTGRMYFDTTLGLPIWYKTASWVKADGTAA